MECAQITGFNYQPSYGTSGLELWRNFDADVIDRELGLGRKYFPRMNAIRLWLSWDAFNRDVEGFARNFDAALAIADKHGLVVMPVLFNRWHTQPLDYGGIYIDHFLPGTSWVQSEGMFGAYLAAIVGTHSEDKRIFAWDLCNEPFSYSCRPDDIPEIVAAEYAWLEQVYQTCKDLGAKAPLSVGTHSIHGLPGLKQIEPVSDVLNFHAYWRQPWDKAAFEAFLDEYCAFAGQCGKPLIVTETCWGSLDDAHRSEVIRYTLGQLKKRGIGYFAYLLHHSLIADAHRPESGPVGEPGNLAFIEADGSLRPGHEVFNEF